MAAGRPPLRRRVACAACCSAVEQVVRRFGDGLDAGVPDAALDRDGVEALAQAIWFSDAGDAVLRSQLRGDDARRGEVVLGHTRCGAVKGACTHVQLGHLTGLLGKMSPAIHEVEQARGRQLEAQAFIEQVALENTRYQMRATLERSPILGNLFQEGRIGLVGGMYSVESGEVKFFEQRFNDSKEQSEAKDAAAVS
jgi:hypothetical protein